MGYITVERHVFYVVPHEYAGGQTHLQVRYARVPMGRQSADRTIKYLDDSIFGALPASFKLGGKSPDVVKNFYMGKGHPWPKLIVADVQKRDLHSTTEIRKLMFDRWKLKMGRGAEQGLRVNQPQFPKLEETKWGGYADDGKSHAQRMAEFHRKTELSASGSRQKNLGVHGADHRPHTGEADAYNDVWLLVDPSKPGKVLVPDSRAQLLAKQVFSSSAKLRNVLLVKHAGRNEIIEPGAVILLGVAYKLHYWQNSVPVDAVVVPAIYDRVHKYMAKFMQKAGTTGDDPSLGPVKTYYAMGSRRLPSRRDRWRPTPSGRVRGYQSFRKGRGMYPIAPGQLTQTMPLFTVKAKNVDEARMKAQQMLERKRWLADLEERDKWVQYGLQWFENGREMITVGALRLLHRARQ